MASLTSKACSFGYRCKVLLRNSSLKSKSHVIRTCSTAGGHGGLPDPYKSAEKMDIEELFISRKVQGFLKKLTGFDLEKIYAPVQTRLNVPRYEFLTDEQLEKKYEEAHQKARRKLQMPPVLRERRPCEEVLAKDPEIQGHDDSTFIFTDISYGYPDRERIVAVREPNGLLRTASWEERERMLQSYFTSKDKSFYMPKMFEPNHLQDVLDRQWYGFVLDRACIQFEPDDPNYIRVTHATYDHIDSQRKFHDLRSTRHFGPMAFYLVVVRRIDNLLIDTLQRDMIEDAADLVRLFYHVHPRSDASEVDDRADGVELVQAFTRKDSNKRAHLELAMQTYLEVKSSRDQVSTGLAAARGLQ
ncbi:28S ribosomal protein S22, mitochondrial [Ixodes scapularis]|uniref:28S ribosomal protein S22, mitochondrial n=1 Tax=Ixodes scapularis TaxID=6945 RepID=UPI001A9F815E|nr:28S ribosomal protein S22, mitochondrial [Ixodes scapularis]